MRKMIILAAPALLAALLLVEVDKEGDGFICREAMDQVREAIADLREPEVASSMPFSASEAVFKKPPAVALPRNA